MDIQLSNLRYSSADNSKIDMEVSGWVEGETLPFTYDPSDTQPLSKMVGDALAAGSFEIAAFSAPATPVPQSITRRQLIIALTRAAMITPEEGEAAATIGALPASIAAMFNTLPAQDASEARVTWASMSVAERSNPLVAMLAASQGMTDEDTDNFFRMAGAL